jgi:hypothetical protein
MTSLPSPTTARSIGLSALVFSALYFLSDVIETAQGGFSDAQLWMTLVAEAAIPVFVIGLYRVQRPRIGRLGRAGALAYAYSYVFFTGTVVYALVARTPDYDVLSHDLQPWMTIHGAVMVIAGLGFGLAVIRAGVLPRWTAVALMAGVVLVAASQGMPEALQLPAAGIRALGLAGMGAALARAGGSAGALRLPGDDLVPDPDVTTTRAITVRACAADVWPWIAQLGQARGGFYSYDVLENLLGCRIHSAEQIVPEWQAVEVGANVRLHPKVALTVAGVDPGQALVLRGGVPIWNAAPPYDFTWAFVLRDGSDGTTRLVVRERYGYTRWWASLIVRPAGLVSSVMTRRMLRGIRERAQRSGQSGGHRVVIDPVAPGDKIAPTVITG